MANDNAILSSIANEVAKVLPGARVSLFGSRALGTATSESDWDILIITHEPVTRKLKTEIHNILFPISVRICSFINTLTVQEDDWKNNPGWYSLQQTIKLVPCGHDA